MEFVLFIGAEVVKAVCSCYRLVLPLHTSGFPLEILRKTTKASSQCNESIFSADAHSGGKGGRP
jgi:hypothetical protein